MIKKKHNKKIKKIKHNGFKGKNQNNDIAIAVITIFVIYILSWIFFWIGVFFLIIWMFKFIPKINNYFGFHDNEKILSYIIGGIITLFLILFIGNNLGKIDYTFFNWSKQGANYLSVTKKGGYPSMEINKEGIVQETAISQVQDEEIKQVLEIPTKLTNGITQSIHDSFLNFIKKLFNKD